MEGPFGLVSSRCLPKWQWSVFFVSYLSSASSTCGAFAHKARSNGATEIVSASLVDRSKQESAEPLQPLQGGGQGCAHRASNAVECRRGVNFSVEDSPKHGRKGLLRRRRKGPAHGKKPDPHHDDDRRHVDNAVDNADDHDHDGTAPARCLPSLRHYCESLVRSKDSSRPRGKLDLMSFRGKWSAPDGPDDAKAGLRKDAHQRSHDAQAQAHERDGKKAQSRSRSRSPGSPHRKNTKPATPPPLGTAALKSLTPEGAGSRSRSRSPARSRSRSPPAAAMWAEETCFDGKWSRPSPSPPSSRRLSPPGPRSRPDSRSPSPSKPRAGHGLPSLKKPAKDAPRPRHQLSTRSFARRFESPLRSSTRKSPPPAPLPSCDESRPSAVRRCSDGSASVPAISKRSGVSARPSDRPVFRSSTRDPIRPRRRPGPFKAQAQAQARSLGSPSRAQTKPSNEVSISLGGALAVQMASSPNYLVSTPVTAHIRLADTIGAAQTKKPIASDVAEVASPQSAAPGRPTAPATSHIKLVDPTGTDRPAPEAEQPQPELEPKPSAEQPEPQPELESKPSAEPPEPQPEPEPKPKPKPSAGVASLEPQRKPKLKPKPSAAVASLEPPTSLRALTAPEDAARGEDPAGGMSSAPADAVGADRGVDRGVDVPESPPDTGSKQRVDTMASDVLRLLKQQPQPRGPVRRRAYEVAIPAGVWKLNFIPNPPSPDAAALSSRASSMSSASSRRYSRGCF
ncbi:hypothetical protein MPTK2_1g02680 [Marchantia polymorpha subsp. ruderalis]